MAAGVVMNDTPHSRRQTSEMDTRLAALTSDSANILWQIDAIDGGVADNMQRARLMCASLGWPIVPVEAEDAENGMWLCDTDPDIADELQETGWVGLIYSGAYGAEACWPT